MLLTKDTLFVMEGEDADAIVSRYDVNDIESLAVDELLSTCRFYAVMKGERVLLTYTTFFAKDDLYRLAAITEVTKLWIIVINTRRTRIETMIKKMITRPRML